MFSINNPYWTSNKSAFWRINIIKFVVIIVTIICNGSIIISGSPNCFSIYSKRISNATAVIVTDRVLVTASAFSAVVLPFEQIIFTHWTRDNANCLAIFTNLLTVSLTVSIIISKKTLINLFALFPTKLVKISPNLLLTYLTILFPEAFISSKNRSKVISFFLTIHCVSKTKGGKT